MIGQGVSVIICCYNSAERIAPTLRHLAEQRTKICWELVLVDNGCTDNTVEIVEGIWERLNIEGSLKIIQQPIAGLTNARRAGVEAAKYEFIVFCDDDNWLADDYLEVAYSILVREPEVGIAGGQSVGVTEGEFPEWFKSYEKGYAVGTPYESVTDVTGYGVWGAGMISRRSLQLEIFDKNFPFLCVDRNKEQLTSGGDGEICLRAALLNYTVVFNNALRFSHYIAPNRLTTQYRDKLFESFVDAGKFTYAYIRLWRITKLSAWGKFQFGVFAFCKLVYGYIKNSEVSIRHNTDYLYFLTGLDLFTTQGNKQILLFYKSKLS